MKRQKTVLIYAKMRIVSTLLLLTYSFLSVAQNVEQIDLPSINGGGSTIGDIITANGKVFVYATDGISIYNAVNNAFLTKVPFGDAYGKFNPVYYNERLHAPDQSIMVYNNEPLHPYIYAITPKMELVTISTINPNNNWTTPLRSSVSQELYLDDIFESQNGRVILRYDSRTINFDRHRLYVLVSGRDKTHNQMGNFHEQAHFFGIYNIDHNFTPDTTLHANLFYAELNTPDDDYGNQINNYTFNLENDYLYLIRLGINTPPVSKAIIDVKQVGTANAFPVKTIEFDNLQGSNWFKMGKVLNILENGLNKIIVLPYRYFEGVVVHPKFCIIDGTTNQAQFVDCPNKRITDAVFLGQNNDLILSYAPINGEMIDEGHYNSNIAVLRYNSGTDVFNEIQHFDNDSSISTSEFDLNTATYLTRINNTTALISKKDGIAKLQYINGAYTYSPPLLNAEGNAFGKGVVINNKSYTLNTVANGLEVFDNNTYTHSESIRTAYQVHHIAANSDGTRLYFYNKLNAYNTGLYAYSTVNETTVNLNMDTIPNNNIETAIGDVVYNPFQNQFLVSKFTPDAAEILVLNASDNSKVSTINISGEIFAKEMFISPQGRLYVTTNMQSNPGQYPKLCIYDATSPSYSLIQSISLSGFDPYYSTFSYYFAHFDYNPYDEKVYATVTVQEQKLLPYNTEPSTVYFNEGNTPITPPGKLLVLADDLENEFNLADFPYKVVCPNDDGSGITSQYKGKLFIVGEKLYMYDYLNPPANSSGIDVEEYHFIDMVYSKVHDRLFAVKENVITSEHRIFEIWTIDLDEAGNLLIEEFNTDGMPVDGQIANMFANPYDGRIYVYRRIDAAKLGEGQVALYSFNPDDPGVSWNMQPLGMHGYHPDYDHTRDIAMFFMTNITTPYINPYTNTMYLPNGGHSSVSKVDFEPNELLLLNNDGYDWISIPRLLQQGAGPNINSVLSGNIFPDDYILNSELQNCPPGGSYYYSSFYTGSSWPTPANMGGIYSERGYKLDLKYNYTEPQNKFIEMQGTVVDPSTPMPLYMGKENWVGYFLYQEQDAFDALESIVDNLTLIKHEKWTCVYAEVFHEDPGPQPIDMKWYCSEIAHNVAYGDMLVLKTSVAGTFNWYLNGQPAGTTVKQEPEYFSYMEQPDYTPVVVELDSADHPLELGVFVGDNCVGACTVSEQESELTLMAYLDGASGEDISFEKYYGTKSNQKIKVSEYFVYNKNVQRHEKRTIKLGEGRDYYQVSFREKHQNDELVDDQNIGLKLFPNPAQNELFIQYALREPTPVSITVHDIFGKLVARVSNRNESQGEQILKWNLFGLQGNRLPGGIYMVRIKAGAQTMNEKLVIQ